jgi:glutathione S-transferase
VQHNQDLIDRIWNTVITSDMEHHVNYFDLEKHDMLKNELLFQMIPDYFKALENRLDDNDFEKEMNGRNFIYGDEMTIADISNIAFAESYIWNREFCLHDDMHLALCDYPLLKRYYKSLHDVFRDYIDSRPKCPY